MSRAYLFFLAWTSALCLATTLATAPAMARQRTPADKVHTGSPPLDSLLVKTNRKINLVVKEGIGRLEMYAKVNGHSCNTGHGFIARWLPDFAPFDTREGKTTDIEALLQISYQNPCDILISPLLLETPSKRRGRRIVREVNKILLPIYTFKRMYDKGSDKAYTLPFSDDGLEEYNYQITDTVYRHDSVLVCVSFNSKNDHHTLLNGTALIDTYGYDIVEMQCSGRSDFSLVSDTMTLGLQNGVRVLQSNRARIDYRYGKTTGYNYYNCNYLYRQFVPLSAIDPRHESLDLTDVYSPETTLYQYTRGNHYRDTSRPDSDSLLYGADSLHYETNALLQVSDSSYHGADSARHTTTTHLYQRSQNLFRRLPQKLVGSSDVNAFGTDLHIYGPLNPASVGYDKINGITLRERLRWSHLWNNGQSLILRPEVGFSFGLQELRYKFETQYIYAPARRAGLRLLLQNGNSGFPSKFRDAVNDRLDDYLTQLEEDGKRVWNKDAINFNDLNLEYYRRYEFRLEHSVELSNGLMLYVGSTYNYRRPVRHGSRAMSKEHIDQLINRYYADMNPYLRLEWTPRQYYHFDRGQKFYLASRYPTMELEVAQGVYGFCGSTSNYSRLELDMHQCIPLGPIRSLSYHIGGGAFFRLKDENFINYSYFSRSQYPDRWETHIGGVFSLLDDYWYSSSPGYIQSHVMYETPFMLLHHIRPIAKYVIKERLYASQLWADGKNFYSEFGYGMGNNYFNVGLFCSFTGLQLIDVGVKFAIEIDQHL